MVLLLYFKILMLVVLIFCSNSAQAYNSWYQQGFSDGIVYNQRSCDQRIYQSNTNYALENERLKQQVRTLQSQLSRGSFAQFDNPQINQPSQPSATGLDLLQQDGEY